MLICNILICKFAKKNEMRYLDPKNDLTFKKIFAQHTDLAISLLNALLPLNSPIETITYLTPEQVPDIPGLKNSIVDVRCVDQNGRTFIVEMQMFWTNSFQQRVVFNAAKSYVRQLERGKDYEELQPVYALNLVNDKFDTSAEYYHHYSIVHSLDSDKKLEGLEFVFVELPKFVPTNISEKKMHVLWLRFLTEIKDGTENVPQELLDNQTTKKALEILKESSFTNKELDGYDRYWDIISTHRSIEGDKRRAKEKQEAELAATLAKGLAEGIEQGLAEGIEQGELNKTIEGIKKALIRAKLSIQEIAEDFEVTTDFVIKMKEKFNL